DDAQYPRGPAADPNGQRQEDRQPDGKPGWIQSAAGYGPEMGGLWQARKDIQGADLDEPPGVAPGICHAFPRREQKAERPLLGSVARSRRSQALYPESPSVQLERMVGLRDRGARRRGMPSHRYTLPNTGSKVPHRCGMQRGIGLHRDVERRLSSGRMPALFIYYAAFRGYR